MSTQELFSGIAVIIDDEINQEDSNIYEIAKDLKKRMPVATYSDIPDRSIIPALAHASFVIIDWEFKQSVVAETEGEVSIGNELKTDNEKELVKFINELVGKIFVPVFVFTNHDVKYICEKLSESEDASISDRIFIKSKTELSEIEVLFGAIEDWLQQKPSVYALKVWERSMIESRNNMFLEFENITPNWVNIIWKLLKDDCGQTDEEEREANTSWISSEFGNCITDNLCNRVHGFDFDAKYFKRADELLVQKNSVPYEQSATSRIIQGARYIDYKNNLPHELYTGDLFMKGNTYYLNILSQCDLLRRTKDEPLYCIRGKKCKKSEFLDIMDGISLTNDFKLCVDKKEYDLSNVTNRDELIEEINNALQSYKKRIPNAISYRKGTVLNSRNDRLVIPCIANEMVIEFSLQLWRGKYYEERVEDIDNEEDLNDKVVTLFPNERIGRLLPPYITKVQQMVAHHFVRVGWFPVPKDIFPFG